MNINLKINPLPLLKENGNQFLQCFDILITINKSIDLQRAVLKVKSNVDEFSFDFGLLKEGENKKEIFLPEVLREECNEFILHYSEEKIAQKILIKPVKRWTIYLVLHSHTDLGFTATVSEVAQIHNDNTDVALLYCNETEHWPDGSRFKWTCEVSWQIQNYIRDRNSDKIEELMKRVRKGNVEIGALYSGELTEILGHEQAVRSFYYSAKLRREYNIPIQTAMLCDVPGCTKGFVQIMAKSGIKNIIVADNNFIAPFLSRTDLPRPFYWLGHDKTRVLAWYTDHPFYAYIEGENYGLSLSYSETRKKLPYKLIELESSGYTYDEFQLQYAFDNFRIEFRPAAIVREWNEKWAYPKIKLSTASEFLDKISTNYSGAIPERKGDWTNWWSGIVTGFPHETSMSRYLHNKIPSMEILKSSLDLIDKNSEYFSEKFESVYDQTLAFDEHSGSGMVWEPKSEEQQKKALSEGYGFIENSCAEINSIENNLKEKLSHLISNENESEKIIVYNSLNLSRNGFVEVSFKSEKNFYLMDNISGKKVQTLQSGNKLKFYCEDVPPLGYKTYDIIPGNYSNEKNALNNSSGGHLIIEDNYYKVSANKNDGKIFSIICKTINKEITKENFNFPLLYILKPKVPFQMGKYIPELYNGDEVPGEVKCFGDNLAVQSSIMKDELAGFFLLKEYNFDGQTWLKQKLFLENGTIKIENILNGELLNNTEFLKKYLNSSGLLYFQFSFNFNKCGVRYESPCSVINPKEDQFKGSCKDYYAVQNWYQIYDEEKVINFSSVDAPLSDIGEPALMKYRNDFTDAPENIFARAVSLNEFGGRSKSPYTKNPDLIFRFSVSSQKYNEKTSLISAGKFGQENNHELIGVVIPSGNSGLLKEGGNSFFEISPGHVQAVTIKKAESNNDLIIRIRETIGFETSAVIKIPAKKILDAYKAMMTEEILENLNIHENSVQVILAPFAVETIRLKLN